jgi:hypothetical protein
MPKQQAVVRIIQLPLKRIGSICGSIRERHPLAPCLCEPQKNRLKQLVVVRPLG